MILQGDARALPLRDGCVQCCVTSPPYWGLRDYGVSGQLGLEKTPEEYVANMVQVFREVWRVLRVDGTLWLNLGDSYAAQGGPQVPQTKWRVDGASATQNAGKSRGVVGSLKPKDLCGIPWRVAFALQADGWYLRSDIIWSKPNPMPESVTDRPTKAHEYLFLLSKAERYYYDADAIAETALQPLGEQRQTGQHRTKMVGGHAGTLGSNNGAATRNARSVWHIATQPFSGAHFATFPPALAERCILAGSKTGDLILDPFGGSGATGAVAVANGRRAVIVELNPKYIEIAKKRVYDAPLNLFGAA